MNKTDKFIDWLCGKGGFPFFKDMPQVAYPIGFRKDKEIEFNEHDCHLDEEDGCEACENKLVGNYK